MLGATKGCEFKNYFFLIGFLGFLFEPIFFLISIVVSLSSTSGLLASKNILLHTTNLPSNSWGSGVV